MSVIMGQKYLVLLNVQQTVPTHSSLSFVNSCSTLHMVELTWVQVVNGKPSHPCGEALVEPKLTPPVHCNKVTEPLMSKLVGNNVCHPVSVAVCGRLGVEKYGSSAGILISMYLSDLRFR